MVLSLRRFRKCWTQTNKTPTWINNHACLFITFFVFIKTHINLLKHTDHELVDSFGIFDLNKKRTIKKTKLISKFFSIIKIYNPMEVANVNTWLIYKNKRNKCLIVYQYETSYNVIQLNYCQLFFFTKIIINEWSKQLK